MAQGDSVVSICNIALISLGEDPLQSVFPPDNTKAAILCANRYDDVRRGVLRSHPWNCNTREIQLAASSVVPAFGYGTAYPVPADYIRIIDIKGYDRQVWKIRNLLNIGPCILIDDGQSSNGTINVEYSFDLQDPTQMDPLLIHSIAYDLLTEIGAPLTQDENKIKRGLAILEGKLSSARMAGSQEQTPREWEVDIWLSQRR
jgi:hypothetical protein